MDNMISKPVFSYKDIPPSEKLSDYIDCYWEFQIDTAAKKCFHIVPDGLFDLILTIKNDQVISSKLTGIWDKTIKILDYSSYKKIGIRFKPAAVKYFIKQSISDFLNSSVTFDAKYFKINNDIFLNHDNNLESVTPYLNNIFERLLVNEKTEDRLIKLYKYIDYTKGNTSVDELSNKIGLSARQIHRVVSYDLGISPKTYIQIVRVKKLLNQINRNSLFPENSFFDQSHFIKTVKRFTGTSPKNFASLKNVRFLQF